MISTAQSEKMTFLKDCRKKKRKIFLTSLVVVLDAFLFSLQHFYRFL
ncbi:unnamed protein product [Larinioides sclopetarius]|uniref:Uncharacterized protein n=1 Tax=Larinioides sclopetarius TaxID=280406 RepID=A0AAV1ZFT7_9ARAC